MRVVGKVTYCFDTFTVFSTVLVFPIETKFGVPAVPQRYLRQCHLSE